MAIPDFQTLMLPVLASAREDVHVGDVVARLADKLSLTDDERAQLLPSGRQTTFANRVHWAKSYLGKAGLVELTSRGRFKASATGLELLSSPPSRLDMKFLERYPSYVTFKTMGPPRPPVTEPVSEAAIALALAPDEVIRNAREQIESELATDLLSAVMVRSPSFFEGLVVRLLVSMGYGGSLKDAGLALGRSGDGGVDGVIDEDALGLDRVYVQAKRYAADNTVGSGAIRDFFGALDTFKASKGLFVTTSSFSQDAIRTAGNLSKRIVLVDGYRLAELMIRYDVGCRVEEVVPIKRLDEEFFEG